MLWANKKSIVRVEQMNEDFTLETQFGTDIGLKGDYLCTELNGDKEILSKNYFEEMFVPVRLVDKEQMAQGYIEMADINKEEAQASVYTYNEGMFQSNKAF